MPVTVAPEGAIAESGTRRSAQPLAGTAPPASRTELRPRGPDAPRGGARPWVRARTRLANVDRELERCGRRRRNQGVRNESASPGFIVTAMAFRPENTGDEISTFCAEEVFFQGFAVESPYTLESPGRRAIESK